MPGADVSAPAARFHPRRAWENRRMDLGLRDRACIVTGGSRGIGLAVAQQLSGEGAKRAPDRPRRAGAAGRRRSLWRAAPAVSPSTSLSPTPASARSRRARSTSPRWTCSSTAPGMSSVRALEDLTDDDWQAHWDIHVMAPMRFMRAAIPVMAQRAWGRVVNVSSSSGKRPGQRNVAYSVSKAAALSLSRAYADQYASRGVLVNAVTPGPVASELWLEPGGLVDQTVDGARRHPRRGARGGGSRPADQAPGRTRGDRRP